MSDKNTHKEREPDEETKEGELNVDILDAAFDDHGFGDDDQDEVVVPGDDANDEESAEWLTHDDPDSW